jgi:hypothetical protein
VPGDSIILVGDRGGRIRSFVDVLKCFPAEPQWSVVGGFAVNVRITHVHRLTNDLDTVSRDQTSLVEVLVAQLAADRLDAAKLQIDQDGTTVVIDVMADSANVSLPTEPGERAFALARRMALATSEWTGLQVVEDRDTIAEVSAPIASVPALIALKTVAIPRRSRGNSPEKVGSDIHDLVRLVQSCDFDAVYHAISETGEELCEWVGNTLVQWFSPAQDLRYTYARLRRMARSTDAEALTEDDLAIVAELGHVLLG